jgi:DNA-binding XRE family transcriptional regulator
MSQAQFGKKIGTSQTTIGNYESGLRFPDLKTIVSICKTFDVNSEWLLMGTGPMYRTEQTGETADMSAVLAELSSQPFENINTEKKKTADMSAVLGVQRELTEALRQGMEFQKQVMTLTQENADLRIQLERQLSRIRDLEREAAEVPALKARIAELERELSERPKLPKTVPVDVSAKSKPTSAHGAGTDTAMVPGAGVGVSGVANLGALVRRDGE